MTTIKLEIQDCSQCPFLERKTVYTSDSFERPEDWFCKKNDNKKIAGYVEWHDKTPVPDWCPIKTK